MKTILSLFILAASVFAQSPHPQQKRPLGVPADAAPFNGRWYKVYLEHCSYASAETRCASMGGQVATVPDESTWNFLKPMATASLWIGLSDEKTEGVWRWNDGTALTFSAWNKGEPSNHGASENNVATSKGGWNDVPKSGVSGVWKVSGFICQWPKSQGFAPR